MSRSYQKHGYDAMCSNNKDKWCRSVYHRCDRRKVKELLKEVAEQYIPESVVDLTKGNALENEYCMLCMDCDSEICAEDGCFGEIPFLDYMDEYPNKDANICHEPCCIRTEEWELLADKIITKGKDYSVRFSERWSWGSDGGVYFQADLSTVHRDFDKNCLKVTQSGTFLYPSVNDFYQEYCTNREAKHNKLKKMWHIEVRYKVPVPAGRYNRGTGAWIGNVAGQHNNRKNTLFENLYREYDSYKFYFNMPFTKKPIVAPDWVYKRVNKEGGEITQITKSVQTTPCHRFTSIWSVDDYALSQNIIPDTLWGRKDLKDYLIAHREEICKGWFRRRFGK